jgi:hypothetical protein
MPSVSSLSSISLSNLGPLTTTFTPPPSCLQSNVATMFAPASSESPIGHVDCKVEPSRCLPSQPQLPTETAPPYSPEIVYFSPGLVCPAGWKTVGSAVYPTSRATGGFQTCRAASKTPPRLILAAVYRTPIYLRRRWAPAKPL